MNIRAIIVVFAAFSLSSCYREESRNRYIIAMEDINFKQLEGKLVVKGDDDLTIAHELLIVDSLCILINSTERGGIFRVYDIENFNKARSFGEIGQGPNDFLAPPFFISTRENDGFSVIDRIQARIVEFCNANRDSIHITSTREILPLLHSSNVNQIDENLFIGTKSLSANGLFFMYDYSQDVMEWISYTTRHSRNLRGHRNRMYISFLRANKDRNLIVCALRFFNRIVFFDFDGNHVKEIQIGYRELTPEWQREWNMVSMSSTTYFLDMCTTTEHIYILWVNAFFDEIGEFIRRDPAKVFVFNWEKELVSALQLDKPISRIAVSEDGSMLLGLADDGTGLTDVIKYDLRSILSTQNELF